MIDSILQQVRYIPLPTRHLAQHNRLGEHPSRQRGSGLDFDQIREYQHGETVRKVNWAAMARKGCITPLVNTYYEEKDTTVILLVDVSASMDFGSQRLTKKALAAEICASLVYSALRTHDRVGFMGFASDVVYYVPPRHSWTYQRTIPACILTSPPASSPVSFTTAVDHLERWFKHPALVFLLSDFLTENVAELRQALAKLQRRHDLISLLIMDPLELSIPTGPARLMARDLETGKMVSLSFTRRNQRTIQGRMHSRARDLHTVFQSLQLPHLTLTVNSHYAEDLTRLFLTCHRRVSA